MDKVDAWDFSKHGETLPSEYGGGQICVGLNYELLPVKEHQLAWYSGSDFILYALKNAYGPIVWKVELSGQIRKHKDFFTATSKKYIKGGIDITDILLVFARKQALSVLDNWSKPVPDELMEWLKTGDKVLMKIAMYQAEYASEHADSEYAERAAKSACASIPMHLDGWSQKPVNESLFCRSAYYSAYEAAMSKASRLSYNSVLNTTCAQVEQNAIISAEKMLKSMVMELL
jgi:hypothetical protein